MRQHFADQPAGASQQIDGEWIAVGGCRGDIPRLDASLLAQHIRQMLRPSAAAAPSVWPRSQSRKDLCFWNQDLRVSGLVGLPAVTRASRCVFGGDRRVGGSSRQTARSLPEAASSP